MIVRFGIRYRFECPQCWSWWKELSAQDAMERGVDHVTDDHGHPIDPTCDCALVQAVNNPEKIMACWFVQATWPSVRV